MMKKGNIINVKNQMKGDDNSDVMLMAGLKEVKD